MNQETWQQLLSLESRDIVTRWFKKIHGRELNARRAKEIGASARQAREFFRNANYSSNAVRPLLTFYGVAGLGRALTLLFNRVGGEETLTKGHGLETVDWTKQLSGDLSTGLSAVQDLKIKTCRGLFMDMASGSSNTMPMHVQTSAINWRVPYPNPVPGDEFTLAELMARIPDLRKDHEILQTTMKFAGVNDLKFDPTTGLEARLPAAMFHPFKQCYSDIGYTIQEEGDSVLMTGSIGVCNSGMPQFMHAYVNKLFGSIPPIFIVEPLSKNRYSQLCITYLLAYFLGMLVRYYPTHWVSLSQGEKGDALWPIINRTQHLVEHTFPELVIESILDAATGPH